MKTFKTIFLLHLLLLALSGCSTQTEYLKFYPVHDKSFTAESDAKLIRTFNPDNLDSNHSIIGYVTAEQVLRECPRTYEACKNYKAEKPLGKMLEQYTAENGGVIITHPEKRFLRWVGERSKCLKGKWIITSYDSKGNPIKQYQCIRSVKYKVDFDSIVLHGLVWRKDNQFSTTREQRLNQVTGWRGLVKKYAKNCLIISPSAQSEFDSNELKQGFRNLFVKVHRHIMGFVGTLIIDNTKLKEGYDELEKTLPEIPCKIHKEPYNIYQKGLF